MIKCPNPECGHENVDGTQFCEMCGEELAADGAASADAAAATPDEEGLRCPACDVLNPPENLVCEVCGTSLRGDDEEDVAPGDGGDNVASAAATDVSARAATAPDTTPDTTPVTPDAATTDAPDVTTAEESTPAAPVTEAAPVAEDAPAVPAQNLQPGRVKLTVEQGMAVGKQYVLGDEEMLVGREDEEEEIFPDIDLSDQDEGFVHRRHAILRFEDGTLTVMHLGGANKTRVNNRPIPDNAPQPLKLGDKIAFGKVVLRLLPL